VKSKGDFEAGGSAFPVCTLARRDLESCRTRELIINGDGSTFAYPMYSKWIKEYERADPGAHFT